MAEQKVNRDGVGRRKWIIGGVVAVLGALWVFKASLNPRDKQFVAWSMNSSAPTNKKKIFHKKGGCRRADEIPPKDRQIFKSTNDAEREGYEFCDVCHGFVRR